MDRAGAHRSCALAVAVVAVGACGRLGFDPIVADASPPLGPFGPAMELEEVSTTGHDHAPTLTADRLEIYFESKPGVDDEDIWRATRLSAQDPFGPASVVAELSSPTVDTGPKLAADGLTIWFVSDRPGGVGSADIWTSTRPSRNDPWSAPVNATGLNSPANDYSASPDLSLLLVVVQSDRAEAANFDLFVASRPTVGDPWSALAPLDSLNTPYAEAQGFLSEDALTLYFGSDRPGGAGSRDMYVATRPSRGDPFVVTERLAELASTDIDDEPWVSPDGRQIVFSTYTGPTGRAIFTASR